MDCLKDSKLSQTSCQSCESFCRICSDTTLTAVNKDNTRHHKDSGFWDADLLELESGEVDGETGLLIISLEEVENHCTWEDGWMVLYDKVRVQEGRHVN